MLKWESIRSKSYCHQSPRVWYYFDRFVAVGLANWNGFNSLLWGSRCCFVDIKHVHPDWEETISSMPLKISVCWTKGWPRLVKCFVRLLELLGIPSVMVFWPLFPGNRPQSIRVSHDNNIKQQRSRILISYTWLVPFFYKTIDCEDVVLQVQFI